VWLLAAAHSVGDSTVPGTLLVLWTFLGLLPVAVGVLVWVALRSRPAGRRFVVAALLACAVGLLTMFPITPYIFAF
jgi:glucan phosphoethanolaminetransferase (alkaline phosphatase superfamily)